MDKAIGIEVMQAIKKFKDSIKPLSIRLVGIVISTWLIVGAVSLGVVMPALIVKAMVTSGWQREAHANVEKKKASDIPEWQSRNAVQGQMRVQTPFVRKNYVQSSANQNLYVLRNSLRETGNNVRELRRFVDVLDN